MHGIEFQQMGGGFGTAADFVDMDELKAGMAPARAQGKTPHAAKAVDADTDFAAHFEDS
jgi:hypothetical protein